MELAWVGQSPGREEVNEGVLGQSKGDGKSWTAGHPVNLTVAKKCPSS